MRALLWMTLFAVSVIFAEPVNLAQLKDDYIAQSGDTLTDTLSGDYMLSIADGAEVVLKNVVVVGDEYAHGGAGITCKGSCTIILEDSNYVRPFSQEAPGIYIPEGHTLVIDGPGSLDVRSDGFSAGIGGSDRFHPCGDIEIRGGVITVDGGTASASIGGADGGKCGNILISGGTIYAKGHNGAAAIGCGKLGKCGNVTITSGVKKIVLEKDSGTVSSIGLGSVGIRGKIVIDGMETEKVTDSVFTFVPGKYLSIKFDKNHKDVVGTMENQKVVYRATSLLSKNAFVRNGWTFVGWNTAADGKGVFYADHAEIKNTADKLDSIMTLYAQWKENAELSWATIDGVRPYYFLDGKNPVSFDYVVTSLDGRILKEGSDYKVVVTNGQKEFGVDAVSSAGDYVFTVKGVGGYKGSQSFEFTVTSGNVVNLASLTGDYVAKKGDILTGKLADSCKVSIAADATIKIKDAVIDSVDEERYQSQGVLKCGWDKPSWSGLTCEGNCTIILEGENIVKGYCWMGAGIYISQGHTLTIDGKGSLKATAGGSGVAGIGGSGDDSRNGNIVILDGKIVADGAPGIGGGSRESSAGGITIKGGSVTAKSVGDYAAGIGGGYGGYGGRIGAITISGGTVVAEGGKEAPAIGGGSLSDNNVITISGGNVTATGGYFAAGIGCGLPSSYYGYGTTCASVTISGGTVVSEGGIRAWAAIGGDRGGVVISGGDVTAIGTYQVAGIGSMDSVVISGGVVTAVGGRDAPGIGAAGETASEYRTFGDIIISGGEVKSTGGMYSSGLGAGVYSHGGNIIITPDVVKVYVDVEKADDSPYSVGTASYGSTLGKLIIDGEEWDYRTEKPFIYYGRGYKDTVNADSGRVSIGYKNSRVRASAENISGIALKKSYNAMGRVVDSDHKARGAYYQKKCLAR